MLQKHIEVQLSLLCCLAVQDHEHKAEGILLGNTSFAVSIHISRQRRCFNALPCQCCILEERWNSEPDIRTSLNDRVSGPVCSKRTPQSVTGLTSTGEAGTVDDGVAGSSALNSHLMAANSIFLRMVPKPMVAVALRRALANFPCTT